MIPSVVYTYVDNGVTYVQLDMGDGTFEYWTQEQYDYYVATQKALADLSSSDSSVSDQQIQDTLEDPANTRFELGSEVGEDLQYDEVFVGSPTPYSDGDVSAPALFASLPDVDNTFSAIIDWFGDTFFVERTNETVRSGYQSQRYSISGGYQIYELPFEETVTETVQVLNPAAISAAILVVLTFVTVVTWLRSAIFGRMS